MSNQSGISYDWFGTNGTGSDYFTDGGGGDTTICPSLQGNAVYTIPDWGEMTVDVKTTKRGIHPNLYFKYIKTKFKPLQKKRMKGRLDRIKAAFYKTVDAGQDVFAKKTLKQLVVDFRESAIWAKGVRNFIEKSDLDRHKYGLKDGKIADTMLKDFTRAIPDKILKKKKQVEDVFDDFVVYHYWSEKQKDVEKMDDKEKSAMRDPVLFGIIKETNRLYFIGDWEDEYCDLRFEDLIDVIGKEDDELTITKEPDIKRFIKEFMEESK